MTSLRTSAWEATKSPASAIFALTDMQHARGRHRTSAVKFTSAVSGFWFCREVIPFCREGIWFCLELKIWFRRYLFDFAVKVFGFTVSYLVLP